MDGDRCWLHRRVTVTPRPSFTFAHPAKRVGPGLRLFLRSQIGPRARRGIPRSAVFSLLLYRASRVYSGIVRIIPLFWCWMGFYRVSLHSIKGCLFACLPSEPVKFTFYIASFFMLQFLNGCVAILKTTFSTRAQRQCAVVLSMSVLQDSEDGLRQALSPRLHGRKYTVHCQPPPPLLPHPVGLRTLRRTNDGPNPRRFWGCCLRAAQLA